MSSLRFCTASVLIGVLAAGTLTIVGCDDDPAPSEPAVEHDDTDDRPQRLPEEFDGLDCPSVADTAELDDADAVFGTVVGVDQTPLADISVSFAEPDDRAEPTDPPLAHTMADGDGRWCFVVSAGIDLSQPPMVVAHDDDELRLRRPVTDTGRLDVKPYNEALVQFLVAEGHRWSDLKTDDLQRLQGLAADATADVQPLPDAGIDSLIARHRDAIEADDELVAESDALFQP